jgi:tetratricopeptide (TPR) repeat protein
VVNQMTCPWYLPRQEFLALLWRTFILSEIGDKEAAPALLDRVRAVNDLRGGHLLSRPGILERLQADLNRGAFLVPEPVWGCLPRPGGGRFRAGAFFYVAGENELARSLFQEAQASPTRTRAKRDEQAVILYGLACCDFSDGKDEQAISRLSKFTDELRTSPLAASAQMLLANIYSGIQGKYKDALAVYDGIAGRGAADSSVAAKALLAKAVSACNHNDNPTALDTCKQLRQVYGRTPYGLAASTLASRLEDGAQTLRQEMPRADPDGAANRGNGRIVLVRRHLVFPGGGDLARASYDDLDVSDLLRYDITTSTIAPCIVVKQYTIRLTEFEPQFEPVAGRACAFLRAPVLFHTMPDK